MFDQKMDRAIKNSPDNVQFTGYVEDIRAAFSSGDLFFFPSKEENEGIVLLEAAAHGLPIVTRGLPAYRGWLEDGRNCLKGNEKKEFVGLIRQVMENEERKEELTAEARETAKRHGLERIGEKYIEIYEEYLGS